jgi:hypothetical protein
MPYLRAAAGRRCGSDHTENPDDVMAGAANLRKQIDNIPGAWRPGRRRDQRIPY